MVPLLQRPDPQADGLLLANTPKRVNGDAALHGYCYGRRNVFCVTYYDTGLPC